MGKAQAETITRMGHGKQFRAPKYEFGPNIVPSVLLMALLTLWDFRGNRMLVFSKKLFLLGVKDLNKLTFTIDTFWGSLAQKEANKGQNH